MKKTLSIVLLICMLCTVFTGTGFTLRDAEGVELADALVPVTEETPAEEDAGEASGEPGLTSGLDALVPVEDEASGEAVEVTEEEEAPAEDGLTIPPVWVLVYIDADGTAKTAQNASQVTADTTVLTDGWWYVSSVLYLYDGLTVSGDVHLILLDDAELNISASNSGCPAVDVSEGNSLTIYAGKINLNGLTFVYGNGRLSAWGGENSAGIGGGAYRSSGNITINGGDVSANGGEDGAGIGGGDGGSGSNITINGGNVYAAGGYYAAAIGGGSGGSGSNITINGGTVTACTRYEVNCVAGAGIGGGWGGSGSDITINGGTVTALGARYAAGIGGGDGGSGRNITINNGTVTAKGGYTGAGIGGGNGAEGSYITINGGTVTATGVDGGAGIGGGNSGGGGSHIYINGGVVTARGGYHGGSGIGGGNQGSVTDIKVAENLTVKAGASANPTDKIEHETAETDIANELAGKQYVTVARATNNGGSVSGICGTCMWTLDQIRGFLTIRPLDGVSGTLASDWSWNDYSTRIRSVKIKPGVKAGESTASMFADCSKLYEADLSGLDTRDTTDMSEMFAGCSALETVFVGDGWSTGNVVSASDMFRDCTSLVGGAGTVYDAARTDASYARADGGTEAPGYLTKIAAVVGSDKYATVQEAVAAASDDTETTVTMVADSRENIKIESTKNIRLDLNGYTLDGGKKGAVLVNEGTLTVTDTSEGKTGSITGGTGELYSGTNELYTGNTYGGGILNKGTLNLAGGKITGNTAGAGGGICNWENAELCITGGEITANTSTAEGGGVCSWGRVTVTGGSITDNTSGTDYPSAGLYHWKTEDNYIRLGGAVTVTGNTTGGKAANLCLSGETACAVLEFVDNLTGPAIGISTMVYDVVTPAPFVFDGSAEDVKYFTSDSEGYDIVYDTEAHTVKTAVHVSGKGTNGEPAAKTLSPKTGDENSIALWLCVLTLCGAAAVTVGKKRREN